MTFKNMTTITTMKKIVLVLLLVFLVVSISLAKKIYINGIPVEEDKVSEYEEYIRYRAIADMVFESSKVASMKYYEIVLEKFPEDFVSLARMSLIYSIRGIPELSLYYGTNALRVYKKSDRKNIYTLNYIELSTSLSVSYALLNNEVMSYEHLQEAVSNLSKLILFRSDYSKAKELVDYANSVYRKQFYRLSSVTNTNKQSKTK